MTDAVKHTPGEWERIDTADYAEIHQKGTSLQPAIALVGKPEDADLIAAAPELLEALKDLANESSETFGHWPDLKKQVETVIAKAEVQG